MQVINYIRVTRELRKLLRAISPSPKQVGLVEISLLGKFKQRLAISKIFPIVKISKSLLQARRTENEMQLTFIKLVRCQCDGDSVQNRKFDIVHNIRLFRIGKNRRIKTIRRDFDHQLHRKKFLCIT